MKKILLLAALALLPLQACQERLPKPTQEGKNTFACKVNGENFIGEDSPGLFSSSKGTFAAYVVGSDYIVVHGSRVDVAPKTRVRKHKDIKLYITGIKGVGVYEMNQFRGNNGPESYAQYYITGDPPYTHYVTLAPVAGQVHITKLDTVRGIISGTFSFKAVNTKDANDVVNITHGRFDISTRRR